MSLLVERESAGDSGMKRRAWLVRAASGTAVLAGIAGSTSLGDTTQDEKKNTADLAAQELERTETRVRAVTKGTLQSATTEHYQAVGDASETFMKLSLEDCELIAQDFLDYYRSKGFAVKPPERRMTVVVFRDERPFMDFARRTVRNVPPNVVGFYSRVENYLVLFDSRNVPAVQRGGAQEHEEPGARGDAPVVL